jgi:hypothetical protein
LAFPWGDNSNPGKNDPFMSGIDMGRTSAAAAPLRRPVSVLAVSIVVASAWAGAARGQGFDLRVLFNFPGNPAATATAPAAVDVGEWSGESGASGHPLMTAAAIRAGAANFRDCLARLWPAAERRGISRAVFERQLAELTPELRIMDLLDSQPEFTKSIWDYLDLLVSDERIADGRAILQRARSFSRHWKYWRAAMCAPITSGGHGRELSDRPNSCRPRSSGMPSISMATDAATSSTRCPI